MSQTTADIGRRQMTLFVPRSHITPSERNQVEPISFNVMEFGDERMVFRLVDCRGGIVDLVLNHTVATALHDCIAMADHINPRGVKDVSGRAS